MSIVRPCPYDTDGDFCKYERYSGEPNFSKCKNCRRKIKRDEEMTDEDLLKKLGLSKDSPLSEMITQPVHECLALYEKNEQLEKDLADYKAEWQEQVQKANEEGFEKAVAIGLLKNLYSAVKVEMPYYFKELNKSLLDEVLHFLSKREKTNK